MAFGDVLAGLAEAGHEHRKTLLQMDYDKRKDLGEKYFQISQNPQYDEDTQAEALKRALELHTLGTDKKIPKEIENFSFTITPKPPKPVPTVEQDGTALSPGKYGGNVELPSFKTGATVQPPTPPPYQTTMRPMPFDEQVRRTHDMAVAKRPPILPKPLSPYVSVNEKGQRVRIQPWVVQNPFNPEDFSVQQQELGDVPDFAVRNAGEVTLQSAREMIKNPNTPLLYENDSPVTDADIQDMMTRTPNVVLRRIDAVHVLPIDQKYIGFNAGGYSQARPSVGAPIAPGSPGANTVNLGQSVFGSQTENPRDYTNAQGEVFRYPATITRTPMLPPPPGSQIPAPPPPFGVQAPDMSQMPAMPQRPGLVPRMEPPIPPPVPFGAAPAAAPKIAPFGPAPTKPEPPQITKVPGAMNPGQLTAQRNIAMPIREVMSSMFGDPQFPSAPTVETYADLALDPLVRNRVGTAIKMILHAAVTAGGGEGILSGIPLVGDMLGWLRNHGATQMVAEAEVEAIQKAMQSLGGGDRKQQAFESNAVHQMIAAYGTIPGLRVATRGSAYQFYVGNLEKELPVFSNVNSAHEYHLKVGILGRDGVNAVEKNISDQIVSPEELARYKLKTQYHFGLSLLTDAELRTAETNRAGTLIHYRKNGTGQEVTFDVRNIDLSDKRFK